MCILMINFGKTNEPKTHQTSGRRLRSMGLLLRGKCVRFKSLDIPLILQYEEKAHAAHFYHPTTLRNFVQSCTDHSFSRFQGCSIGTVGPWLALLDGRQSRWSAESNKFRTF